MERRTAGIIVVALVAGVIFASGAAYAMGPGGSGQGVNAGARYGSGPSMMGNFAHGGMGMMYGHGVMWNQTAPYWCPEYAEHHLNSTSAP